MSFLISLLLHGLLVLALVITATGKGEGDSEKGGGSKDTPADIAPPPSKEIEVTLMSLPDGIGKKAEPKKVVAPECAEGKWYGGVGIENGDSVGGYPPVVECPPGYPAYDAGVRVGDTLLNPGDLRGEPGTEVNIIILRGESTLVFKVKRARICTT